MFCIYIHMYIYMYIYIYDLMPSMHFMMSLVSFMPVAVMASHYGNLLMRAALALATAFGKALRKAFRMSFWKALRRASWKTPGVVENRYVH